MCEAETGKTGGRVVVTVVLAALCADCALGADVQTHNANGNAVQYDMLGGVASDRVIVRVKPGIAPVVLSDGRWTFEKAGSGAFSAPAKPKGAKLHSPAPTVGAQALAGLFAQHGVTRIDAGLKAAPKNVQLAAQLGLDRYYLLRVPAGSNTSALAGALNAMPGGYVELAELDGIGGPAEVVPNDTFFAAQQYALKNVGQIISGQAGTAGADVRATPAWDVSTGSPSLTLAIVDSGVDPHTEFGVRLLTGWNVVFGNTTTSDVCSHGTHVAGIAAAAGNNSTGIAGMNWDVKILPVRIFGGSCSGPESDLANGLQWATDNGADVINMSLQYYAGTTLLHNTVMYAAGNGKVLLAATGNNNIAFGVAYPARWPETIGIGATDNKDLRWSGSNPGPQLDVCAPGWSIYSTIGVSSYGYNTGTSMATPLVSGLACLMKGVDPTLTHSDIQTILQNTAKDLETAGFDNNTGYGRVNAYKALLTAAGINPGDVDSNGLVNIDDLTQIILNWGACAGCDADLDNDGFVDIDDLTIVILNWT